jgi:hypothetical protein
MSSGFSVDHAVLDRAAGDLRATAAGLDAIGDSTPTSVDAGEATAVIMSMLGRLLANAGQLVEGARLAGTALSACGTQYRAADDRTDARLRRQAGF